MDTDWTENSFKSKDIFINNMVIVPFEIIQIADDDV